MTMYDAALMIGPVAEALGVSRRWLLEDDLPLQETVDLPVSLIVELLNACDCLYSNDETRANKIKRWLRRISGRPSSDFEYCVPVLLALRRQFRLTRDEDIADVIIWRRKELKPTYSKAQVEITIRPENGSRLRKLAQQLGSQESAVEFLLQMEEHCGRESGTRRTRWPPKVHYESTRGQLKIDVGTEMVCVVLSQFKPNTSATTSSNSQQTPGGATVSSVTQRASNGCMSSSTLTITSSHTSTSSNANSSKAVAKKESSALAPMIVTETPPDKGTTGLPPTERFSLSTTVTTVTTPKKLEVTSACESPLKSDSTKVDTVAMTTESNASESQIAQTDQTAGVQAVVPSCEEVVTSDAGEVLTRTTDGAADVCKHSDHHEDHPRTVPQDRQTGSNCSTKQTNQIDINGHVTATVGVMIAPSAYQTVERDVTLPAQVFADDEMETDSQQQPHHDGAGAQ